jgi:GMP synthase-like glutamine amidotransferase
MIALSPAHKNQLINYVSWLEKRSFPYRVLKDGDSLENFTMLILTGGPDVGTGGRRDELEIAWLREAIGKIPVLGICRGLQLSNVVMGGTLHQDLPEDKVKHTTNKVEIAGEPDPILESSFHGISLSDGRTIVVNSRHHQGIEMLAPGLKSLATCEDGLVEAAEGDRILLVQWHPERPDVWGTDAERVVYEWVLKHQKPNAPEAVISYMKRKGFTVVSYDRVRKILNESWDDEKIKAEVESHPSLRRSKDKRGKIAVKLISS